MNQKVKIRLRTYMVTEEPSGETDEAFYTAKYLQFKDHSLLTYEENAEQMKIRTILNIHNQGWAQLQRRGPEQSYSILFRPEETTDVTMHTMYGDLPMQVRTDSVSWTREAEGLQLTVFYEMFSQGESVGEHVMQLTVMELQE